MKQKVKPILCTCDKNISRHHRIDSTPFPLRNGNPDTRSLQHPSIIASIPKATTPSAPSLLTKNSF
jgi:hypothetical protein